VASEIHYPNISSALLDLHRLLAIFLSSGNIEALPERKTMRRLFDQIARDEITRILLALAATVRIVDDRTWQGSPSALHVFFDTTCGELIPDVDQPEQREALTIREACNKILHSLRIEPAVKAVTDGGFVLDSRVLLTGTKRKGADSLKWAAAIDVVPFCEKAATALELLVGLWKEESPSD
jgi:hypothetical protein